MNDSLGSNRKTALLLGFIVVASISTILFLNSISSSPLDTSIIKQFVYDIDPTYPPISGLNVDLYDGALLPVGSQITDATGYVTFTQLVDETYTLKWTWGGVESEHSQQIDCSQIVWDLGTNYLESKSG